MHARHAQPHRHRIGRRQARATHLHERPQHIERFVAAHGVFEVVGIRQQRRRKQARVAQAVSVGGARRDPVHMRALGGGGAQLAAKTVGGNPLIVKRIRRDRLPVGSEQIDEAQRQESALP